MGSLAQTIFHQMCVKNYSMPDDYDEDYFQRGFGDVEKFFKRFDGKICFAEKKVLDIGCGYGNTCFNIALNGAKKAVGIDIDKNRIDFAKNKLASDYQNLSNVIDFKMVEELGDEKFDVIVSKNTFEHVANPEMHINNMIKHLHKDGKIAIGFSPLWKSPYGGHITFMTKFPWAHLLFSESVIMSERQRFRPDENAETFEQVVGGLNKMTLGRFLSILDKNKLELEYFKTNVSNNSVVKMFNIFSKVPLCKEYFTINLYCILRTNIVTADSTAVSC